MGLDIVEFIMATEVAFAIDIADTDAARIATPRDLITHLRSRLPKTECAPCLTQRAFYHVRGSIIAETHLPRASVRPSTSLGPLLPGVMDRARWREWGSMLGVETWPSLPGTGWFSRRARPSGPTVGDAARHLATWGPAAVKHGEGWTDDEIERGVVALIEGQLGVDMTRHTLDAHFVRDLRVD